MKLKTFIGLAGGVGIGYVLGTAAGRARFEQLKSKAGELAHDPKVQQTVSDVAGQVKANAHYVPSPFSGLVGAAAGRVQESLDQKNNVVTGETTGGTGS